MAKYICFYKGKFTDFDNYTALKNFIQDKKNCQFKKYNSLQEKDDFVELMLNKKIQKFYICIHNNKAIKFNSWKECKDYISTNTGCIYKGFTNDEQAQEFINKNITIKTEDESNDLVCELTPRGFLHFKDNECSEFVLFYRASNYGMYRELSVCISAIEQAIEDGELRVVIRYKYDGTVLWANGTWETKNKITSDYAKKIKELSQLINIDFERISNEQRHI